MLRKPEESDQAMMAPARIVPFDRARTFVILLVLLHHSVINYTYFGHGDAMRPSAYGIYLLHFIFLIWLQYIVYDSAFPAFIKFAIVFAGTLSMSWALTVLLRKIPIAARTI